MDTNDVVGGSIDNWTTAIEHGWTPQGDLHAVLNVPFGPDNPPNNFPLPVPVQAASEAAPSPSEGTDSDFVVSDSSTESESEPEMTVQAIEKVKSILMDLNKSHARVQSNYECAKRNL